MAAAQEGAQPGGFYYAEEHHMQYLARPKSQPYCTAQPLLVSLPPFDEWAPPALRERHAPRLPPAFWREHAPVEHCALRTTHAPIEWPRAPT